MRKAFINTLIRIAEEDKRIFLLTGDLGFSVLEPFRDKFPGRFLNTGVAEQNMIGVAAGLALERKIVFVFSIAPFITLRCFEQVRNDLCFQNLPVRLIGVGGGVAYGTAGATHYALEDIAIMRSLANMTVIIPGDPGETEMTIKESINYPGPIYIRLGRNAECVYQSSNFKIGKGIIIEKGNDVAIISLGSMLSVAKGVTEELKNRKINACLISMPTVKPLDVKLIKKVARMTKAIFTIEEHSITGGLGGAVAEVLSGLNYRAMFKRFAFSDRYDFRVGMQKYLLEKAGLSKDKIVDDISLLFQRL